MDIGTRLDEAMKLRDEISQSELGRRSEVPQPTINRILKGVGKKGPETATVKKLADALEVRFEWLMEGHGPMEREGTATQSGWTVLARVDEYEVHMLDLLRRLDERGRRNAEDSLKGLVHTREAFTSQSDEATNRDSKPSHLGVVSPGAPKQRNS